MFVVKCDSKLDIQFASSIYATEVVLGPKECSRFSRLSLQQFFELVNYAKSLELKVVFEWDQMYRQSKMVEAIQFFETLNIDQFDSFRVQDIGVMEYIKYCHPSKSIQLVLESAGHNSKAIEKWSEYLGKRLSRLVLSNEMPVPHLQNLLRSKKIPLEVCVLGKLLLFSTPRSLLKHHFDFSSDQEIRVLANSEDTAHKNFEILENSHGTYMFSPKSISLLDRLSIIEQLDIVAALDLKNQTNKHFLTPLKEYLLNRRPEDLEQTTKAYNGPLFRGFFDVNKTDAQFQKIRKSFTKLSGTDKCGYVLEAKKSEYVAFCLERGELKVGDSLTYYNPEGKVVNSKLEWIKNLSGQEIDSAKALQYVLLPFRKQVLPKSYAVKVSK